MKITFRVLDGDNELVSQIETELSRTYLLSVAFDAIDEGKPTEGPEWFNYVREAVVVDHILDCKVYLGHFTWTETERELLNNHSPVNGGAPSWLQQALEEDPLTEAELAEVDRVIQLISSYQGEV